MRKLVKTALTILCVTGVTAAFAAATTVTMNFTAKTGTGKPAGTVQIEETKYGLVFTPNLTNVATGIHGFHVHVKPDCGDDGMAAAGHFDPNNTGKHLGPYNDSGHMGDLAAVYASANGTVNTPILAPRLMHLSDINNHALMVHSGGDNYSDTPQPLGGGDGRMICGIIKS